MLVVMKSYPFPPRTGSQIVAYNYIKHLSKKHLISLVCLQNFKSKRNKNHKVAPAEFVEYLELLPIKMLSPTIKWARSLLSYLIKGDSPLISAHSSKQMEDKVRGLIEDGNFDAILAFELGTIQYCPPSCFHKLIVNIEDPQSIKLNRMRELPIWSLWQKTKLTVNAKLTERYEQKFLHKLAKVILLSESDMRDMCSIKTFGNLTYMPYGVELKNALENIDYKMREKTIIFSGNMYHPPNVDGILYFLKDIFPLVLKKHPLAVLWIVGSNPDSRIHKEATKYGKQVVITGTVDDITVYIKSAAVSICPVRLKIGVQTKLLEALSLGTPVVTTSAGNSGIGGESGVHLWVEDEPHNFALRVVSLLNGYDWKELSNEGKKLVSERFTWETNVAEFDQYLESLVISNK